ncbi:class I SAM-dependent methyltransferase [Saccharopolyspora flava]|uniref:Methyltransferase domain-containing protein n=1 Tax=Saccharopolyspora flava TaxID=95161 RepID=A0A1I6P6F7_9PSEU|nr:class I SAM-dependent methyltransferase [Saccharopolyspora flava]SFS35762.1 Methyltransferase domain-containing protein [Saccharopolyspora flava]
MRTWREKRAPEVTPSPNIWNWPEVYEAENRAQDSAGALWKALRAERDWSGLDVVDVGCGDGFHLPVFAATARSVIGVEPHEPLAERARARMSGTPGVDVRVAPAQRLPLADGSADLLHARTAYFFGPGCEPGLAEAERVLRPGGTLAIIDLDTASRPYGEWMRTDAPQIDPAAIESFFARHHFTSTTVSTLWRFHDRETFEAVLRIEFSAKTAARAIAESPGRTLPVTYRLRTRTKPSGLLTP